MGAVDGRERVRVNLPEEAVGQMHFRVRNARWVQKADVLRFSGELAGVRYAQCRSPGPRQPPEEPCDIGVRWVIRSVQWQRWIEGCIIPAIFSVVSKIQGQSFLSAILCITAGHVCSKHFRAQKDT